MAAIYLTRTKITFWTYFREKHEKQVQNLVFSPFLRGRSSDTPLHLWTVLEVGLIKNPWANTGPLQPPALFSQAEHGAGAGRCLSSGRAFLIHMHRTDVISALADNLYTSTCYHARNIIDVVLAYVLTKDFVQAVPAGATRMQAYGRCAGTRVYVHSTIHRLTARYTRERILLT